MSFEPLKDKKRAVILSTDIAGDCDDVGAIALLYSYAKEYGFDVLGICNCTSSRDGTKTVYALNKFFTHSDVALGEYDGAPLVPKAKMSKYTKAVGDRFGADCPDPLPSTVFYRKLLSAAEDDGVVIVTIGFFTDLSALLLSKADEYSPLSGVELVRRKVHAVVSMATRFPRGAEFNIYLAPKAARQVFELLPVDIYLSDFDLGATIGTGYSYVNPSEPADNPVLEAYRLHTQARARAGINPSFDQTAVQFAVLGVGELYRIRERGVLRFYIQDDNCYYPLVPNATEFIPDEGGNVYLIGAACDKEIIKKEIQKRMEI